MRYIILNRRDLTMSIQIFHTDLYPTCFHLQTPGSSYVMGVSQDGLLIHLHYGAPVAQAENLTRAENSPWFPAKPGETLLDHVPLEYSGSGMADLRPAAISVEWPEDGDNIADLRYQDYALLPGKPQMEGLPQVYTEKEEEAQTLRITLCDAKGLQVDLFYTIFDNSDALIRRTRVSNKGTSPVVLHRIMSSALDLPDSRMELVHLHGAWAREFNEERMPVGHFRQCISSTKGASGHQHNPFAALVTPGCNESAGEVYAASLVYSGNFLIETDVDAMDQLRFTIGLNDWCFSWQLLPGEEFCSPEAVLVYSAQGLGHMSRTYHRLYQNRLCRGSWRDRPRPVLLNTWEGVYFDFNRDKLLHLAKAAAEQEIELFVLDDGWFGHRDSDNSSLGDWIPNEKKLGCTLRELAEDVNRLGMKFGLWVEPEMVSPDSDLYRAHPDWALCRPNRPATLARTQLILDLSRTDVQDYLIDAMSSVFESAPIDYIKWDMNRNMTEIGSFASPEKSAGEIAHRYMLGLYRVMETLVTRFPDILFESCASGGGRFDPGMMYYMPQAWTSDDSDAIQRLDIQGGCSLVYPPSCMSCHVSAVPNHQVGRVTSLDTRWNVAVMGGGFGYELNMTALSDEEKEIVRKQIRTYKEDRGFLFTSELYRLEAPADGMFAYAQVAPDKSRLAVTCIRRMFRAQRAPLWLRLNGIAPDKQYVEKSSGEVYSGTELLNRGVRIVLDDADFSSVRLDFVEKK